MYTRLFIQNGLNISVSRLGEKINVNISSDYVQSARKARLFINEKRMAESLERDWDNIKRISPKLTAWGMSFDQVDYYDNEVNVYETPTFKFGRGKRKAQIGESTWGCIPKDWEVNMSATFTGVKQKKVIIEYIQYVLGSKLTSDMLKKLDNINDVISGKVQSVYASTEH